MSHRGAQPAGGIVARVVLTSLATAAGCASPLPTHPPMSSEESLRVMSSRTERITSVSAACMIDLEDRGGNSISLEGALAARPPTELRIKAWKFSRDVFDLTMNESGAYLAISTDAGAGVGTDEESRIPASGIAEGISLVFGDFFHRAEAGRIGGIITARGALRTGGTVVCEIDGRTLTARRYVCLDDAGVERADIRLDRYRMIGGTPFPGRIRIEGPSGSVTVRLREVELNGEHNPSAFTPPRRAVRLP